jgi:flagellar hook assembly protein FlgD
VENTENEIATTSSKKQSKGSLAMTENGLLRKDSKKQPRNDERESTGTNHAGYYIIEDLAPGEYILTATFEGYEEYTTEITIIADEGITEDINMSSIYGSLRGVITDQVGGLLQGVTITLNGDEYTTTTDADGAYHFSSVAVGEYELLAVKDGYVDYEETIVITANSDSSHSFVMHAILPETDVVELPAVTKLNNNYPNPFNPTTTISFSVGTTTPAPLDCFESNARSNLAMTSVERVQSDVYNIKGQKVRSLVNDTFSPGEYKVVWNGFDDRGQAVGSGMYFYRMRTEGYSSVKKMILMK